MTEAELFAAYGASAREGAYSDDAFGLGTEALAAGGDWPRRSVRRPADGRHARRPCPCRGAHGEDPVGLAREAVEAAREPVAPEDPEPLARHRGGFTVVRVA